MLGEEEELSSKRKVDKHLPKGWLNFGGDVGGGGGVNLKRKVDKHLPKGWLNFGGDFWGRRRSQSHHTLSLIIIFLLLP